MSDLNETVFETATLPPFEGHTAEDAAAFLESELGPWAELLSIVAQHASVPGDLVEVIAADLSGAAGAIAATLRGDRVETHQVADAEVRAHLIEAARAMLEGPADCANVQREYADRLLEASQRHVEEAA